MYYSLWSGNVRESQGNSGKLAMVRGKWHFCSVGQGKNAIFIITKVFNIFCLHLKFILSQVLFLTLKFDKF